MIRSAILLPVLLALSACMPGRIDRVHVTSTYSPEQYHRLPYTGYLRAEVSGNPFAMPQEEFNSLVNDAIQPFPGAGAAGSGYRVHLAFNGVTTTDENHACQATGGTGMAGGALHLVAAFCSGSNQALTYLTGSVKGVTGPEDPNFTAFVRWATVRLFPPRGVDDPQHSFCWMPGC